MLMVITDGLNEHPLMTHNSTRMELQVSNLGHIDEGAHGKSQIMDAVRTQCQYILEPGLEKVQPITG